MTELALSDVEAHSDAQAEERRAPTALRLLLRNRVAVLATCVLALFGAMAVLAPLLAPFDPELQDFSRIHQRPSGTHWFGTDELGRDVLSRVIYGSRVSLLASLQAVGIALVLGVPPGLVAGYLGGMVDGVLSRINDMMMSVPGLVLALTVVAVLGPGLGNAMLAVGVILAPQYFRIMRAATLDNRQNLYVEASLAIGCSKARVMSVHVLPNSLTPVLVQTSLALGAAVMAEAALSFLGLGVTPPTPSWGAMLATATESLERTYLLWGPGVCLILLVLAYTLLGDALNDALARRGDDR